MENKKYLTVSVLNKYLAYKIDSDVNLKNILLQGEISNARFSKGHLYFVLKDDSSEIQAVMFNNLVSNLDFTPQDGQTVIVRASVKLYNAKGVYNLQVTNMTQYGVGLLYQNFLKLKEKLFKEGLFDTNHKKAIPEYAEKIGLITSGTGDAMHDVISTISNRFPLATIYLYPALVQGSDAPMSLIRAIKKANDDKEVEVIIIARGGGSIEDLSCFNDENLARVIYDSEIPIVSGVGHEADFTICDFVSDERAPTPTGAAVKVSKDKNIIINDINSKMTRILTYTKKILETKYYEYSIIMNKTSFKKFSSLIDKKIEDVNNLEKVLVLNSPITRIKNYDEKLGFLIDRIERLDFSRKIDKKIIEIYNIINNMSDIIINNINILDREIDSKIDKLIILNPLNLMKKGYAITYQNSNVVTSVNDLNENIPLVTRVSDGEIESKILKVKKID